MAYQKSHGLQLALNAVIKNFGVETVTADPTVTEAGRAWFNSTSKLFKFSSLTSEGAVQIVTFSTREELLAHIAELAATTAGSSGSSLVGYDGHAGAGGNITLSAGSVAAALDSIVNAIDSEVTARQAAVSSISLQDVYDQTPQDLSGDAKIKLATGKDFKIEDDDESTVYFKVDSETGAVTITGNLYVSGQTTTVESTVTSGDHWALSPATASTVALSIAPDEGVVLTADLVNIKSEFGGSAVFRVTHEGTVIANGRTISTDGANLDAHLNSANMSQHDAAQIDYVNTTSGLTATDVQAAIDELQDALGGSGGTSLSTQIENLHTYVGSDGAADTDPLYSNVNYLVQGTDLTVGLSTLDAAVKGVADNLATETTNRQNADTSLQNELDATQAAAGLTAAGAYTADGTANYISAVSTLREADLALDAALKSVSDDLNTLDSEVGDLTGLTTTDKTTIVGAINEVAADGGSAITDLISAINGQRFVFNSASAAVLHTVNHGLGTDLVSVEVWVMGDDTKWHNDLVPVTIDSANAVIVELSEARNVKVIVKAEVDLV